jgi:hypothetical protein
MEGLARWGGISDLNKERGACERGGRGGGARHKGSDKEEYWDDCGSRGQIIIPVASCLEALPCRAVPCRVGAVTARRNLNGASEPEQAS